MKAACPVWAAAWAEWEWECNSLTIRKQMAAECEVTTRIILAKGLHSETGGALIQPIHEHDNEKRHYVSQFQF